MTQAQANQNNPVLLAAGAVNSAGVLLSNSGGIASVTRPNPDEYVIFLANAADPLRTVPVVSVIGTTLATTLDVDMSNANGATPSITVFADDGTPAPAADFMVALLGF